MCAGSEMYRFVRELLPEQPNSAMQGITPMYFMNFSNSSTTPARGLHHRLTDLLECFFVAHPKSGRKEGEEAKRVMYFFPKTEPLDKQTEITGFAEAVMNFTDNFVAPATVQRNIASDHAQYRDVVTGKTVHSYVMVEQAEFLFGIVLIRKACVDMEYTIFAPAMRAILTNAHKTFRLFFGNLTQFQMEDPAKFKDRLEYFFSRYLVQQRVHQMPLLDYFPGVPFLTLNSDVFTDVDAYVAELLEQFPQVDKLLFLYQDKLVYYTVAKKDLPPLMGYLTNNLIPMSLRTELEPNTTHSSRSQQGKFLAGPRELTTDEPIDGDDCVPTVYLAADEETKELTPYHLIPYRCLNATVCMFVKENVTRHLLRSMDGFLDTELPHLASSIAESYSSQPEQTRPCTDFHYIYFNPSSLSLKTSFVDSPTSVPSPPPVPVSVHKLACDSFDKLMENDEEFGECSVRADNEWWIYVKKATQRTLVLFIPPSTNTTLDEFHRRVQAIVKNYFQSVFIISEQK